MNQDRIDELARECSNEIERVGATEQTGSDGQFEWLYDSEWVRPIIARAIASALKESGASRPE